ncbi:hypothetical protein HPT27_05510 [Permianibacter sp. IMCC34836]|uniref:hypothetical protein n=1 Tax=Permianibacter fluminis TaxID=2738515 RepID=UPI00155220B3|nr:hypothetical protein [Permianibacter fluminis]NQD36476.1 hypothetical protein [Permianibacter fluminis]
MIFYQTNFILACVCGITFYAMAKEEAKNGKRDNGWLWAGLSAALSGLVIGIFSGGWVAVLLLNSALFVGIALFRVMQDRK